MAFFFGWVLSMFGFYFVYGFYEIAKLKTIQNVKMKLKNNNIIHVKADKGNGLVLINKNEYINKTLEFIKKTTSRK